MDVSKTVADLRSSTRLVVQAAQVHGDDAVAGLVALLAAHLPAGDFSGMLKAIFVALAAVLEESMQQLEAADITHRLELADDDPFRDLRDKVVGELYAVLVAVRRIIEGGYGPEAPKEAGFKGSIERQADLLVDRAQAVIERLAAFEGRATLDDAVEVKPARLVERIRVAKAPVEAAKREVDREKREAETTLARRDAAWAHHVQRFRLVANALVALLALAGLEAQASKVRPSQRSPGRTAGEVGEVAEGGVAESEVPEEA